MQSQFLFFSSFLLALTKFFFCEEDCKRLVLVASVMTRLIQFLFKNRQLVEILEFHGHAYVFLQQHGLHQLLWTEWGRILKEAFHKGSYLWCHIQSYPWLESPGGYQIHMRNLAFLIQSQNHESFDPLTDCMWKTCGEEWLRFS